MIKEVISNDYDIETFICEIWNLIKIPWGKSETVIEHEIKNTSTKCNKNDI